MKKSQSQKSSSENDSVNNPEQKDFFIVGIGASAGGIQALKIFFENVPADSDMAYVVILHLSPDHDSKLAEVLQAVANIPVTQVTEKVRVEANHVYVVPPNKSLSMIDGHIIVSPIHTIEERRAPVDIFFRTLAESQHERAVAVVLSGTGANGSMGMKRVKERSGAAFVQNPREAEYSDMPRNSIATKLVDAVLNVAEIPAKIIAYKENLGTVKIPVPPESRPDEQQQALREIFKQLRVRTKHDFSNYKRPTLLRRIQRRINVHQLPDLPAYAAFIGKNAEEAQALLKDLLISVTNFFRDKEAFSALKQNILPRILGGKTSKDQIRVWVAGCATGEEAYSVAMLLAEATRGLTDAPEVQIFATDIDEYAIANARKGFYTLNDAADVPPERLHRFFNKDADGFRVRRELREMVLFANHNIIKDPPFSRLDLATCRNMLIYLNNSAQERVMETLHFALNPGGFLFLGTSESIDGAGDLYAPVSREHRIYQSRQTGARRPLPVTDLSPSMHFDKPRPVVVTETEENRALERLTYADLHQQLLEQYAAPSVVVNENFDILHLSERAGKYLQIAGGDPSMNLLKVARQELRFELHTALYQAVQRRTNVEARNLKVHSNGDNETINLHVRPVLRRDDTARGFLLVLFEPTMDAPEVSETVFTSPDPVVYQLDEELTRTKTQLRTSVEQYEIQTEELRASNEELQAMNEELRTTTEELETSKEELQSINEELLTVNQELKIKIEELIQSNSDFQNLMNSTDIGTIFLDRGLHIKMFTPSARDLFNLIPEDINRPLSDITTNLYFDELQADMEHVLDNLQTVEREIKNKKGAWFLMRIFPYRTTDDRINGVVITFLDITRRIEIEQALREFAQSRERQMRLFDMTLSTVNDYIYNFDRDGRFLYANQILVDFFGLEAKDVVGKTMAELDYPKNVETQMLEGIRQVFETKQTVVNETSFIMPDGSRRYSENILNPFFAEDGTVEFVVGSSRNITERKRAEATLSASEKKLSIIYDNSPDSLYLVQIEPDNQYRFVSVNETFLLVTGYTKELVEFAPMEKVIPVDNIALVRSKYEQVVQSRQTVFYEETAQFPNGLKHGEISLTPIFAADGAITHILGVVKDVTERKQIEEALRESEESLRLLIESATEFAIFTLTPDNLVDSWNAGAEKVFGFKEEEIINQSGTILFTPEDRAAGVPEKEIKTAAEKGRAEDERWHIRKDGSRFFASGMMMQLKDGKGFVKIARDMTDKIAAEKVRRDKEMLQKLVGAQEDERKRIARDLHDELGQQLTALRLQLESARKICGDEEVCDKIDEIQLLAKHIDNALDFLVWELRPTVLDDLGLTVALDNYVKEWSRHSGVTAEFHGTGLKEARLLPEIETNFYRIAQEALNNTHKHAQASQASLLLEQRDGLVVMIIEDDGIGFEPENKANRNKGLGLIGMRERAALIGGILEIESAPGSGTTIFVRVPVSLTETKDS